MSLIKLSHFESTFYVPAISYIQYNGYLDEISSPKSLVLFFTVLKLHQLRLDTFLLHKLGPQKGPLHEIFWIFFGMVKFIKARSKVKHSF
jgi:hypothetical protein